MISRVAFYSIRRRATTPYPSRSHSWPRKLSAISSCKCRPARRIRRPPIGPALGQRGLNIMEFCKAFNAQTQGVEPGLPIPVVITAFRGQVLHLRDEDPPATIPIKKAAGIKGFAKPHTDKVGKITALSAKKSPDQDA